MHRIRTLFGPCSTPHPKAGAATGTRNSNTVTAEDVGRIEGCRLPAPDRSGAGVALASALEWGNFYCLTSLSDGRPDNHHLWA